MPNSYGRVKVPLDDALNYFIDYYNKVYDKKTDSVTSDEFNRSIFLFLGPQESHRNQIKNLRISKYVVYAKAYKNDYVLVIHKPCQNETPTYLSDNQIKILEGLLEYVNTHIDDIKESSNSLSKEGLFILLIFIIFVIALVLYST